MAYFNKIGLLLLNKDRTKFLVCEKNNATTDFIMPGGKLNKGESDIECLREEIMEELAVKIFESNLEFIGEYLDVASSDHAKDVSIRLYEGKIIGTPQPSTEIIRLHWIGKDDLSSRRLSPIIKNKILPDLIRRKVLL